MGANEEVPEIVKKHPQWKQVFLALAEFRDGRPNTATCGDCGARLVVTAVAAIGATWVTCPHGCTRFRSKQKM